MKAIKLKPTLSGVVLSTEEKKSIIGGVDDPTSLTIYIYKCVCVDDELPSITSSAKANCESAAVQHAYTHECSGYQLSGIHCAKVSTLSGMPV